MVALIGIDWATQPNKVGLALAEWDGERLRIKARRTAGLIQSVPQACLQQLRAWVEVGWIALSQCLRASLPQPISI